MQKFEYKSAVLIIEKKWFAMTSKDVLGGISQQSEALLAELGEYGWELVSVVRPSFWLGCEKSLIAFFKRSKT
jgi:hypothetical protein